MEVKRFERWCEIASSKVRYGPDRKKVSAELQAHMEDRLAELMAEGVERDEAEKSVLRAMGDAGETAVMLGKIHNPFWGYLLVAVRLVLAAVLVLALGKLPSYLIMIAPKDSPSQELFEAEPITDVNGGISTRTFYAEPMSQGSSDGYTFTLTRAALRHYTGSAEGEAVESDVMFLSVDVFNPRPWAENSDILREFYAVDSLGHVYQAHNRSIYGGEKPVLSGNPYHSGWMTVTWDMWLSSYQSQKAEWIELRYDMAGRDIRLRIDLTGGEADE